MVGVCRWNAVACGVEYPWVGRIDVGCGVCWGMWWLRWWDEVNGFAHDGLGCVGEAGIGP